jgi:iron-sulfur cluster repair protein YtfE (RIC family)
MLNQITPARTANTPPEDALDLLLGCHLRIRHFASTAAKLAHAQAAAHDEIRMTAAGLYRYFSVSLPLHEADEEDTLRPRLDSLGNERVHHALVAMHDQHQAIDELIERLLPLAQLLERNPSAIEQVGGEMCGITKALEEIFAAHLKLEEEEIFPAIRGGLPKEEQAAMLQEMQSRRLQGSSQ